MAKILQQLDQVEEGLGSMNRASSWEAAALSEQLTGNSPVVAHR